MRISATQDQQIDRQDRFTVLFEPQLQAAKPSEGLRVVLYESEDPDFTEIFGCEATLTLIDGSWRACLIPETWFRVKGEGRDIPRGWRDD